MSETKRIKTALVSVYHKEGLDEIITKLHEDPQAQPDMPEMQPGNPPGDSFARVDKRYETAD